MSERTSTAGAVPRPGDNGISIRDVGAGELDEYCYADSAFRKDPRILFQYITRGLQEIRAYVFENAGEVGLELWEGAPRPEARLVSLLREHSGQILEWHRSGHLYEMMLIDELTDKGSFIFRAGHCSPADDAERKWEVKCAWGRISQIIHELVPIAVKRNIPVAPFFKAANRCVEAGNNGESDASVVFWSDGYANCPGRPCSEFAVEFGSLVTELREKITVEAIAAVHPAVGRQNAPDAAARSRQGMGESVGNVNEVSISGTSVHDRPARQGKPGRPRCSQTERDRRIKLVTEWLDAKKRGEKMRAFCGTNPKFNDLRASITWMQDNDLLPPQAQKKKRRKPASRAA